MADPLLLLDNEFLFDALMDNLADSIYFKDRQCRLIRVSHRMALDVGFSDPHALTGKTDRDLFGADFAEKTLLDDLRVMETGLPILGLIESRRMENGELNWTSTSKVPIRDRQGDIIGLLGITREINAIKQAETDLHYMATHDLLTGLPNRYLFFDRLDQSILRATRQEHKFALLYIDMDGFKSINDRGGHDTGDWVLKTLAQRLIQSVRCSDLVARMGGDEFVILLDDVGDADSAVRLAEKLLGVLQQPYEVNGQAYVATASIGVSLYPAHAGDSASLLKAADHAMYLAKQKKNTVKVFAHPRGMAR